MDEMNRAMAAYPAIAQAIVWVEGIVCGSNDGEQTSWELMTSANLSIDEMIEFIKESTSELDNPKVRLGREQMDLPLFRTYIAGKLGML